MAVYTHLSEKEISAFLSNYAVGVLKNAEGIVQGIDNTNYKITSDSGRYILTIFEKRIDPDDLPFFLGFMDHLSKNGINCPPPVPAQNGNTVLQLAGKPAALFPFLSGSNVDKKDITPQMCRELGVLLGKMHIAGENFPEIRANSMGIDAWQWRLRQCKEAGEKFLEEISYIKQNRPSGLPKGAVHLDAFPDNVFTLDGHISAVIDFYFAATDDLAFDLAIVLNAWCFDLERNFVPQRWENLLSGYEEIRPLKEDEKRAFQILCRAASLRFLSSRLYDLTFHDPNALVAPHDPDEYIKKLEFHRDQALF